MFSRVTSGIKGYRLWMKDSKGYNVNVSRDVFKEDLMPGLSDCIAGTCA